MSTDSKQAMDELTTDQLEGDPENALAVLRAYVHGGGALSAGWALALMGEVERLGDFLKKTNGADKTYWTIG